MTPNTRMTIMATLLTAAGLFSLLAGILEAVRVFSVEAVDGGLTRLGLAAMIVGGLTTATIGLAVLIGRGGLSLPRTVAAVAGWLTIWFPLSIALGISTDAYPASQLVATAICVLGISAAVVAFARSRRGASGPPDASSVTR